MKQNKGGGRLWIPASQDLRAVLDPWLRDHGHMIFIVDDKGRPWKKRRFEKEMRSAYGAAGLDGDVTTHGLRYTAATVLEEIGCTYGEIGDITDDETARMVQKYTEQRRRSRATIARLDAHRLGR